MMVYRGVRGNKAIGQRKVAQPAPVRAIKEPTKRRAKEVLKK